MYITVAMVYLKHPIPLLLCHSLVYLKSSLTMSTLSFLIRL